MFVPLKLFQEAGNPYNFSKSSFFIDCISYNWVIICVLLLSPKSIKCNSKRLPSAVPRGKTVNRTRRLAACTQAVITLRSTSYIAIELKCSAFEVMRNSIESMCLIIK